MFCVCGKQMMIQTASGKDLFRETAMCDCGRIWINEQRPAGYTTKPKVALGERHPRLKGK